VNVIKLSYTEITLKYSLRIFGRYFQDVLKRILAIENFKHV